MQNQYPNPSPIVAQAANTANITEGNIDMILKDIPDIQYGIRNTPIFKSPDDLPEAAVGKPTARFTVYDFPFTPNVGEVYQVNTKGNLFRVDLTPGDIYQVNSDGNLVQIAMPFSYK